jgi:hypothetical protein
VDDAEVFRRSLEETRRDTDPLLAVALQFAVPMWIEQVKAWSHNERQARAHAASDVIAYGGGAAHVATAGKERGRGKKGEAAQVFNAIACGLAILSFCRDGVTWAGSHWETRD